MKRIILIRLLAISTITACTTNNTDHAAVPADPVPYPEIVSLRQINGYSDVANLSIEDGPYIGQKTNPSDFGIRLSFNESGISLENIQNIYFATGSDRLSETQKQKLVAIIPQLRDKTVSLQEFADPRAFEDYNLALSQRRVRTVTEFLESNGISVTDRCAYGENKLPGITVCGN